MNEISEWAEWLVENDAMLAAKHIRDERTPEARMYKLKHAAKRRGLEFDLTIEDFDYPAICPVLGIPLDSRDRNHQPSMDRLDSSKGYTKDNICVISFRANRLKQDSSIEDLEKILAYMRNKLT